MKTGNIIRAIAIAITIGAVMLAPSCKSTPKAEPADKLAPAVAATDPNSLPPEQDALDALEAARARADASRDQSMAVQAHIHFTDEWNAAETSNESGKSAGSETLGQVSRAITFFTTAANSWDELTAQSAPMFAEEMEVARAELERAAARAEASRKAAMDSKGNTYFPDDWKTAEGKRAEGAAAPKLLPEDFVAASALYTAAADGYDDITARSAERFAQEQSDAQKKLDAQKLSDAQKALAAAQARAEKSRQAAVDVDSQTYFANDWKAAEAKMQTARSAKKGTADEMVAATAQFTGAADAYDGVAGKARPQFTKDKDAAQKALQAAIARAQKSRAAVTAAKADAAFANDWKAAEAKNQTAAKAKQATIAEMKAAAPLYNTAADAYDDIVRKNAGRASAADAVAKAKARSDKSAAYAAAAVADDAENSASIVDNKYIVENKRLVALADKNLADAKYDDVAKNAADAEKSADQSDAFVDAYTAYNAAGERMAWADKNNARRRYADVYAEAQAAYGEAGTARSGEKWDETKAASLRVVKIMEQVPEEPPLPAQYLVKGWSQARDCLWNIAALPEVYNDPAQWQRLYAANRSKFPEPNNPNLIEPGMLLDIPSINNEFRFGVLEGE